MEKEALHIHLAPEDQRFNQDVGLEMPLAIEFLLSGLACETMPTIISLINKGFSPF